MNFWHVFGLESADTGEKLLFFITGGALLALAAIGIRSPQVLNDTFNEAFGWVLTYFGWWFMLLGMVLLVFSTYMVFSRYGHIRIGGQDAEPEFDLFSWLAMVFTVGYSGSIIIWGVGEPISIVNSPPPEPLPVTGASIEALALAFMFIHEVFPGLAMWYPPFALAFGLIIYTRGTDSYKFSSMLKVFLDDDRYKLLYWTVDLAALIAIIGGVAAAIGFSAQVFAALLDTVFGVPPTLFTYGLFGVLGLVFLGDVWLGLRSGIRNAARITVVLMLITFALLLAVGPTLFTINLGLDAGGVWLNNMFRLSLYSAPTAAGNWPQQWTSFWWAWWAAWGLFVGSFVARVSKGRTIRETFVCLVVIPGVLLWIQHSIVGGWVLAPGYVGPVSDAFASGGIPASIATAVTLTPLATPAGSVAHLGDRRIRRDVPGLGRVHPLFDNARHGGAERSKPGVVGRPALLPRRDDARTPGVRRDASVSPGARAPVHALPLGDRLRELRHRSRILSGRVHAGERGYVDHVREHRFLASTGAGRR